MFFERPMNKNTVDDIIEKFNIKELIEFERFCRDQKLWEKMKECFHKDSFVKISWFSGSGYEYIDASQRLKSSGKHRMYNTLIWLNSNRAIAESTVSIQSRNELDGIAVDLISYLRLHYRVEKRDEVWKVFSVDGIYEKESLVPQYPNSRLHVPEDKLKGYRASYAYLSLIIDKENLDLNSNLPGEDRPELISELYNLSNRWLEIK